MQLFIVYLHITHVDEFSNGLLGLVVALGAPGSEV